MDPITGATMLFSALKTSGSGGTSQMPPLVAAPAIAGAATSSTGAVNNVSGQGMQLSGSVFWVAVAVVAAAIGYVIVKEI